MSNIIRIESKLVRNRTLIERLILAVALATDAKAKSIVGSKKFFSCEHRSSGSKLSWKVSNRKLGIATIR